MKDLKKCTKCSKKLPHSNFFRDATKKDGSTSSCRMCLREVCVRNYEKNSKRALSYGKKRYQQKREEILNKSKVKRIELLTTIHNLLGNECNRCGVLDKRLLNIDHINGGGGGERRRFGGNYVGYYKKIIESISTNKKEYQLLCWNCNQIEALENGLRTTIWQT